MLDIRWKQRFINYDKTINLLQEAMNIQEPDIVHKAGIIHFFEMAYELAWNTLKDYLEEQGIKDVRSPRATVKKAFELDFIQDGQSWMELLQDRSLTAHTYDEQHAGQVAQLIRQKYFPLLKSLHQYLQSKVNE